MLGLLILLSIAYALLIALGGFTILWQMSRPRRKTLGVALAMGGVADPADLGMAAAAVTFNLSDRTQSPGWIITGHAPQGPTVVVVHGHRDSRYGSLYRAQMVRPYAAYIVVFDLPGHGDAQATRCRMGAREAADVNAVVHGLPPEVSEKQNRKRRPIVLLGYSLGATIVIKAAAEYPELFNAPDGKTSSGGGGGGGDGVIACAPYRWWDEGLRGQMKRRGLPVWPMVPLVGLFLRLSVKLNLSRLRESKWEEAPGFDRAADAAKLTCPLLVLHGDADTICPLSAGRAIADAAPRGQLVVIKHGTHNQLLAADHDAVHAALAAFFKLLSRRD